MKSHLFTGLLFCCVLFAASISFSADKDTEEIQYLLGYLAESGCTFIRNGDEYEATKARDHLEMKYNYAKRRIKTAEDFINKLASKSSLSRKAYSVKCGEVETLSKKWLEDALQTHRLGADK